MTNAARKRRRGSSDDDGHLLSTSRRLLDLGLPHASAASSASRHEPKGPVAFSSDGLVAYRAPQSQPPRHAASSSTSASPAVTIAIKPLLAAWTAKPLLLSVPVLPIPTGGYSVRFLSFNSLGNSLVAIVEPDEEAALALGPTITQGVVCIWSRRGDASALNEGWSLAAAWPLASNGLGPFGPSVIAAQWLPSSSRASQGGGLSVVAAGETMQETPALPSAQLPGMAQEGKAKAKKSKVIKVERSAASGPVLLAKGTKRPEGLLLIGEDGRAHLIHRDTSIHVSASSSSSSFHVQTTSLSFPSMGSPDGEPASAPGRPGKLQQAAMHAVANEPVLLIATTNRVDRQNLIRLCEVTITNEGDEAVIVARPLESINIPAQASSEESGSSGGSSGHEGAGLVAFSSWKAENRESIHLICASAETSATADVMTRTSLFMYTVERRTDISGRGSLCDSFSTLESRKKQVKDLREQLDWASHLQNSRLIQDRRGLVSLVGADRGKGKLRAVWQVLHENKATLRRSESLIDAVTLEEESVESPVIFPTEPSWSTNGALAAWVGPSSIRLRVASTPSVEERSQIEKLAVAVAGPLLNNRTYHDVLLGNVKLLAASSNRRKLLEVLAQGLDWQSPFPAAQKKPLPNIIVLTKLLGVHKSICAAVEIFDSREPDTSVALESLEADWTLALIRAFKILQCCRNGTSPAGSGNASIAASWDIASLFSVLPVLSYLNEQCESLAREAFLTRSGQPITPPESPPKAGDDTKGEHSRSLPSLSVLDLLTRPLLRKIFLLVLRAAESLKLWVRSISVDKGALRELAASEAKQLAQEVRIASHARAASRASAQVNDGGAEAERERERERERESQQLKAETLSAIEANRAMAVSARLEVARLGIEEMERKSAVYVDVLEKRLRSWTAPASAAATTSSGNAADGAIQDWTWPVGSSSEDEGAHPREEVRKSLARHLLSTSPTSSQEEEGKGSSRDSPSPSPLKNHGLPLFLTEDDFIHTLADLSESGQQQLPSAGSGEGSSAAGKGRHVPRDGVTFALLATSASRSSQAPLQRRRDLTSLEGRSTTLLPRSRQSLAHGIPAGHTAASVSSAAVVAGPAGSADLLASTLSLQNVLGTGTGTSAGAPQAPAPSTAAAAKGSATPAPAPTPAPAAAAAAAATQAALAPPLSLPLSLPSAEPLAGAGAGAGSGAGAGGGVESMQGEETHHHHHHQERELDLVTELLARPGRVERMLLATAGGVGDGGEGWWLVD